MIDLKLAINYNDKDKLRRNYMKKKMVILNGYRVIVDEINFYYPKDSAVKNHSEMTYRIYIEFTNREALILKCQSPEERDNILRMLDAEFDR